MKKEMFPSLNGLRALSIIIVIFSHQKDKLLDVPYIGSLFKYIFFLSDGHLGVNIFFVISGYLITMLIIMFDLENSNKGKLLQTEIEKILK